MSTAFERFEKLNTNVRSNYMTHIINEFEKIVNDPKYAGGNVFIKIDNAEGKRRDFIEDLRKIINNENIVVDYVYSHNLPGSFTNGVYNGFLESTPFCVIQNVHLRFRMGN